MGYGDDIGVYGNSDAKARLLLSDPLGGSPVFGPWVDLPGVAEVSVKAEVSSIEGQGDDEVCVDVSRIKSYTGKVTCGRESISALKVLVGGASSSAGTTPNQQTDWEDSQSKLPLIELQWRPNQDEGDGDVIRTLHRCRMKALDLADKFEAATQPSFEFKAVRRKSDGKRFSISVRETGVDLVAGTPDPTAPTVTAVTPTDGGTAASLAGVVAFTLSAVTDPVKASDPGNYYYAASVSGAAVPFGLVYSGGVATLTPTSPLSTGVHYVAGVTRGIQSMTGVRMAAQYAIDFTAP